VWVWVKLKVAYRQRSQYKDGYTYIEQIIAVSVSVSQISLKGGDVICVRHYVISMSSHDGVTSSVTWPFDSA